MRRRLVQKYGAFINTNLSLAYNVGRRFTFRGSIDNLFDVKPPHPYPASGATGGDPTAVYFPGILERYFRVGAAIHF